ncbi:Gfo/Idh/MocA family oxidoreductase [soil metagenome]
MAGAWLQPAATHPDLTVVGLSDLNTAAAEKRRDEFAPGSAIGRDFSHMLAELRPDVVFNCTVPAAHFPITEEALRAGSHVLSEKPLANSMAEARSLVETARTTNRLFAISQNYRYNSSVRTVQSLIGTGVIGELTAVDCDFAVGAHFDGFRLEMEHVLLHDMSIHHFDLARLFSDGLAVEVFCKEWNPKASWYRHGANAHAIFTLSEGIVFSYRGSWCAEGTPTSWSGTWRFVGTKGTLRWDGADGISLEAVKTPGGFFSEISTTSMLVQPAPGRDAGHASIINEFVACLQHGTTPETNGADNLHSLAMVFGAIESASRCLPVKL